MKLISVINKSLGYRAKIYDNKDWGEYVVKFYLDNKYLGDGPTYFSDDINDARDTAISVLNKYCEDYHNNIENKNWEYVEV